MRKLLVDDGALKGLHCAVCKKDLENEERVVESTEIFGRWMCMNCFYDREKRIRLATRMWG